MALPVQGANPARLKGACPSIPKKPRRAAGAFFPRPTHSTLHPTSHTLFPFFASPILARCTPHFASHIALDCAGRQNNASELDLLNRQNKKNKQKQR